MAYEVFRAANRNRHSSKHHVKKAFFDLVELFEDYCPCTFGCEKTHKRAKMLRDIRKEYSKYLPRNYVAQRKQKTKKMLIDFLDDWVYNPAKRQNFIEKILPKMDGFFERRKYNLSKKQVEEMKSLFSNQKLLDENYGVIHNYINHL